MKLSDRLLIALYALLGLLLLAFAALYACMPDAIGGAVNAAIETVKWNIYLQLTAIFLGVVVLTWTARVFMLAFKHEPAHDRSSVSLQHTEDGAVRISVTAMEALVRQAVGRIDGMTDIKTRIINHEDSITVKIDMALEGDARIPNITMLMQRNVKKFIEEYSGIAVREVEIVVSSIKPAEVPLLVIEEKVEPVVEVTPEPDHQAVHVAEGLLAAASDEIMFEGGVPTEAIEAIDETPPHAPEACDAPAETPDEE